jgi:hypothetical protein
LRAFHRLLDLPVAIELGLKRMLHRELLIDDPLERLGGRLLVSSGAISLPRAIALLV